MILNNFDDSMLVLLIPTMVMAIGVVMAPYHPKIGTYVCYTGCAVLAVMIIIFSILLCCQ